MAGIYILQNIDTFINSTFTTIPGLGPHLADGECVPMVLAEGAPADAGWSQLVPSVLAEESLPTLHVPSWAYAERATRKKRAPVMEGKPHRNETAHEEDDACEALGDKRQLTGRRSCGNG